MKIKFILSIIITVLLQGATFSQTAATPSGNTFPDATQIKETKLSYKIINTANNTFGYDIYSGDKMLFHQTNMPAMPGNLGFATKAQATSVAQFVITKIKNGEMPPTVSVDELKKLKAIK